uniref:tRNA (34-2'-O)-methyltransferase regulator WDR6 n=1 Tax=Anopheles dirus TaxID=7168 RepID=A0A182N9V6_9DIPT
MRVLTDAACIRVICSETLLVAVGNQLLLLYLSPHGKTRRTNVPLPRLVDKIHGIETCLLEEKKYLIVFHAGREAYSIILDCQTHAFSDSVLIVVPEKLCPQPVSHIRRRTNDWISSISLLSSSQLCIVTSHGVAVLLKAIFRDNTVQWGLIDKSPCEDGSTLYCSTITGQQWDNVIVLSGTALGLLLVWTVAGDKASRGRVLQNVSAHNGVIFSIACDFDSGLLTTTSDDRSIKFWKIDIAKNEEHCSGIIVNLREERYCFAHTARVFQCRIIKEAHRTLVASIGEDSHLCLWTVDGDLVLKKRLDEGPTLWNMDYDPSKATIFITASNGNLHKYCIRHILEDNGDRPNDQSAMVDVSPTLLKNEHLAKIRFITFGSMVAVTNQNRVMIIEQSGTITNSFESVDKFKCSIIEVGQSYLYLAGGCSIQVYDTATNPSTHLVRSIGISFLHNAFHCEGNEDGLEGAIRSVNFCARSKTVAICDASGRSIVFDEAFENILSYHRIPSSAERWLTSFATLNDELLLMADRSGHLYLLDRAMVNPVFKLANVHGKLGITSIITEERNLYATKGYFFKTTGHDGRICELFMNITSKTLEMLTFSKSIVGWIDRTMVGDTNTFFLGFNDSHFFMVDAGNETYTQFDCGGGHRCWDFYYDENSSTFTYVFIQHKRLKRVRFTPQPNAGSELMLPRFNWHTRACNALLVVPRHDSHLLLSGGEDNILRINVLQNGEMLEQPRRHLFNHISSIKTVIAKKRLENDSLLMISAGGRAQICVASLDLNIFSIKQECEYMLLATDAERSRWKANRRSTFDPETKFMCAAFLATDRIVFGCSDGFIRIFQLSANNGLFTLTLENETFYGRCILKVVSAEVAGTSLFITVATDGYLCFWDVSYPNEPIYRYRHQSSGVNAIDLNQVGGGNIIVATGGDDQSVAVSLFDVKKSEEGKLQIRADSTLFDKYLHTAQVTGLKLLDDDKMISVGVDQRVYITSFANFTKLAIESETNTCVADVKGISFLQDDGEIVVYGCGIEIMSLKL